MNSELRFRLATKDDLPDIIKMLADDEIGNTREKAEEAVSKDYLTAFEKIVSDSNQELTIVEVNGISVATFHLTFIQYLTHHGGRRAQVEAVRTHADHRGKGIGKKVFAYIIERAKEEGCVMVQLTTDKRRSDAIKFYEAIGFIATHEGMKLKL